RQIHTIKKTEIQHLINNWTKNGLKARTIRRHIAVLKAIFNHAINDDCLMKNPAHGVTLQKPEPVERHPLSPEEASRLLGAIDPYFKPLIYIALTTGLRWSELAGLQLQDLGLEGPEPHLTVNRGLHATSNGPTFEKPKSTAGHRTLPLSAEQVTSIKSHIDSSSAHRTGVGTDPVFMTKKGRQLEYQNFANRIFNPAVKKAGLKDVRIHDLRRTTATLLVANQVDLKTVEAWMGHSDVRLTLSVYASHTASGLTLASRVLSGQFVEKVQN
ncbi:MAG: site-specific integrase, partial [Actinobacteria bacterium]|nr:site-specific integrase [Actinomycetota bacterium]